MRAPSSTASVQCAILAREFHSKVSACFPHRRTQSSSSRWFIEVRKPFYLCVAWHYNFHLASCFVRPASTPAHGCAKAARWLFEMYVLRARVFFKLVGCCTSTQFLLIIGQERPQKQSIFLWSHPPKANTSDLCLPPWFLQTCKCALRLFLQLQFKMNIFQECCFFSLHTAIVLLSE